MRICLVVQRYGADVLGGAETLARTYAALLSERHEVVVATSCAREYARWRDEFPPGESEEDGVSVRRFAGDFERTAYWHELHGLLLDGLDPMEFPGSPAQHHQLTSRVARWSVALQEELIRRQGPYPSGLFQFLRTSRDVFDRFVFFTLIYPPTYFGLRAVARDRALLVPTLHDEPIVHLPVLLRALADAGGRIFLTQAERALAERLVGRTLDGAVVGTPVLPSGNGSPDGARAKDAPPYLLFAGRLDPSKGADRLLQDFVRFKRERGGDLQLRLIGERLLEIPAHPDVRYEGFVDERRKAELLRKAFLFVHPSPFESLGIVLLESFAAGVPALVSAGSDVLVEHCRLARGGLWYRTYEEFAEGLSLLLERDELRERMGSSARAYVRATYEPYAVAERLETALEIRDEDH